MTSISSNCVWITSTSKPLMAVPPSATVATSYPSCCWRRREKEREGGCGCSLAFPASPMLGSNRMKRMMVRMAPEEEKLTRRNPLDFPIEWERPKPGRRPDIFPQFSPMKTPIPPPLPYDPPEEDEEEEEEEKKKEEEEEDPEKEQDPDKPDNQ